MNTIYNYLIEKSSNELRMAVVKLRLYRTNYKFDFRNTVVDLLNIGTSYKAVNEYEYLHDQYHLQTKEELK